MRQTILLLLVGMLTVSQASAQVNLGGQVSVHAFKSDRSTTPRVLNRGRASFGWRFDLFVDGKVTDNVLALANVRLFEDESINFDYLAIRITNIFDLNLNFQAGRFDMPFGNLAERRFPEKNFLFGLPLIYEYRTALPNVPTAQADLLINRGRGVGMRMMDFGIYDIGAMVFGTFGRFHIAAALSNGSISAPSNRQLNVNKDFGKTLRLTFTPMMGLILGTSGSIGAYLPESTQPLPRGRSSEEYKQMIGEVDLEFSRGPLILYGEAVLSDWEVPLDTRDVNLRALGYYAEAKVTVAPRWYVATRVSGLLFSDHDFDGVVRRWDYDMLEVEGGVGVYLARNTVLKIVRRETRTLGVVDPHDNLSVVQLAVAF